MNKLKPSFKFKKICLNKPQEPHRKAPGAKALERWLTVREQRFLISLTSVKTLPNAWSPWALWGGGVYRRGFTPFRRVKNFLSHD